MPSAFSHQPSALRTRASTAATHSTAASWPRRVLAESFAECSWDRRLNGRSATSCVVMPCVVAWAQVSGLSPSGDLRFSQGRVIIIRHYAEAWHAFSSAQPSPSTLIANLICMGMCLSPQPSALSLDPPHPFCHKPPALRTCASCSSNNTARRESTRRVLAESPSSSMGSRRLSCRSATSALLSACSIGDSRDRPRLQAPPGLFPGPAAT